MGKTRRPGHSQLPCIELKSDSEIGIYPWPENAIYSLKLKKNPFINKNENPLNFFQQSIYKQRKTEIVIKFPLQLR